MNKEEDYTQAAMKMLNKRMEPKIKAAYKKLEERFKNKEQAAQRMGQRITALRKLEGISQQELADRAGLTRQHIGRIEKGELVSVAYVTIQQIAEALGMTVDIIDPGLTDLAPLKRLTPPMTGTLGTNNDKVTDVFKEE